MSGRLIACSLGVATLFAILAAPVAQAGPVTGPVVVNGSFEQTTLTTKGTFLNNVTGWSGGANLTFLDYPGTATTAYLDVYGPFPATSPDGGNFVEMDGDPNYSSAIYQTLTGLAVGDNYAVSFDQAAGQQAGFHGATTELWAVSLGSQTLDSAKYSLPQGGVGAWEAQSLVFTANAASETLKFLAVGTPSGMPPISFLDGVAVTDVPEPSSLAIFAVAALGLTGASLAGTRRRRALAARGATRRAG